MRFDRNIYFRLYHIAFFMPDYLNKNENEANTIPDRISHCITTPIGDSILKDRINNVINQVLLYENTEYDWCKMFRDGMNIIDFERRLFYVCLKLHYELDSLFSKSNTYDPKNITISQKEINEASKGAFNSFKSALLFYSNFANANSLYYCSSVIKKHERCIPLLKHIKTELYQLFSTHPIKSLAGLNDSLFDLSASIDLYSSVEKLSKDVSIDSFAVERIFDKVIIDCYEVSKQLFIAGEAKKSNKEKNKKISDIKRERNSEQNSAIQMHLDKITNIIKTSLKARKHKKGIIKEVCSQYFEDNKNVLELYNIKSAEKLQRKYSQKDPNKQRSEQTNGAYKNPDYSKIEDYIKYLYSEFKESERKT